MFVLAKYGNCLALSGAIAILTDNDALVSRTQTGITRLSYSTQTYY